MKILPLLALLWLGATQTVSFSNCCRGIFCSQKDDCPPCGGESEEGRICCESEGREEEPVPCVHVEPSTDLVSEDVSPEVDVPAIALLPCVPEPSPAFEPLSLRCFAGGADPPARPEGPTPLYLLNRALLI